jgi:hypothetical protein
VIENSHHANRTPAPVPKNESPLESLKMNSSPTPLPDPLRVSLQSPKLLTCCPIAGTKGLTGVKIGSIPDGRLTTVVIAGSPLTWVDEVTGGTTGIGGGFSSKIGSFNMGFPIALTEGTPPGEGTNVRDDAGACALD